jgi:hypothetical protein
MTSWIIYSLIGLVIIAFSVFLFTTINGKRQSTSFSTKKAPAKVKMGTRLGYEITAINQEGTARIIVAKGSKRKWKKFTSFTIKYAQQDFRTYFLNYTAMWSDRTLHYLRDYETPVDEEGNFVFEDWNELALTDSGLNQFSEALGNLLKFQFSRNILTGMVIVGLIGLEVGFTIIAPDYYPNTIVHWLTNKPAGFP